MTKVVDLLNKRFGKLTVTKRLPNNKWGQSAWLCKCDCGKNSIVDGNNLRNNHTKSCGCLPIENSKKLFTTHGRSKTREYKIWKGMHERCNKPQHHKFPIYGGRGIKICDRWLHSFENFYNDMGDSPTKNHSIDRIDTNGNYEPTNCRWATHQTQTRNRNENSNKEIKTGKIGVVWKSQNKKWLVRITADYKIIHIGYFKVLEEAIKARNNAEAKYWT